MIFLILTITTGLIVALSVKVAESKGMNTSVVMATNYVVAMILGWILIARDGHWVPAGNTLLLGIGGGILWPFGLYYFSWGVRRYGIALTGSVSKLGLLIPILFALIFLNETVTPFGTLGIFTAFIALILLSPVVSKRNKNNLQQIDAAASWYFPGLVLILGTAALWANLFNTLGAPADNFLFLTLIYTFAAAISALLIGWQRSPIIWRDVRQGIILGLPNFATTFFLIETLKSPLFTEHSTIAYTINSVAGLVLTFLAGVILWHEKVTPVGIAGVATAITAVILLNLG